MSRLDNTFEAGLFAPVSPAMEPRLADHLARLLHHGDKDALAADLARSVQVRPNTPRIYLGMGTCGLGAGAADTRTAVEGYLGVHRLNADLVEVGCIGLCSEEPLMDVELPGRARLCFGRVEAPQVPEILDAVLAGQIPGEHLLGQYPAAPGVQPWQDAPLLADHPFFKPQKRWVLINCGVIDPVSLTQYLQRGGYSAMAKSLLSVTPDDLCRQVVDAGLKGRGGGGFPAGVKWQLARKSAGEQKYLVCNADEGDPGAFMDRAVIEGDPHRLLEGMVIAAYAIGATKAYVYIRAEYPLAIERLKIAIGQATAHGLLGQNILGSGFNLDIIIKQGAGAFVCGEETALMGSIEGRRGMPKPRPPYPAAKGLFGMPTCINNVETLANVPGLVAMGPDAFKAVGTAASTGTKVFALSGKVNRTGLVEVVMGTTIRSIVFDVGGGIPNGKQCKAVQIGGPSGGCIPTPQMDIQVDYESLKAFGAMMGSGGLVVMDEDTCMVDVATFFMEFIQKESCGKCIPCREGTRHMLEIMKAITRGRANEKDVDALLRFQGVMYLERLAEVIKDTSLCGLGQTAPNPVLSTLRWFRDEYEAHVYERRCPAKACRELLVYTVDPERCKGCTLCTRVCPAGAIMGAKKSPHYIVPDKCIGCGSCKEACRFDAITIA